MTILETLKQAVAADPHDHAPRRRLFDLLERRVASLWRQIVRLESSPLPPPRRLAALHGRLADVQAALADLSGAHASYRRCLQLDPAHPRAPLRQAQALLDDGRYAAAEPLLRALVETRRSAQAMALLGGALVGLGRDEEASRWLERAVRAAPRSVDAHLWAGRLRARQGRADDALACFDAAVEAGGDTARARVERGRLHLRRGDYARGWSDLALQPAAEPADFLGFPWDEPPWRGETLDGQIVLAHERTSLVEAIALARFAPRLAARGARVMLGCPCELVNLLRRCDGVDHAANPGGARVEPFAMQVSLQRLPAILDVGLDDLWPGAPYITPAPASVARWRQRLAPGLRVGLAPAAEAPAGRASGAGRLAALPGTVVVPLQAGVRGSVDLIDEVVDMADLAGLIAHLDLVVAADNAPAHLAAAMGRRVWLLLPRHAHWRWMDERTDTPWYPTMRLFRQQPGESWEGLVDRVAAALRLELEALRGAATR